MASSMPERDANHVLIFVWLSNNRRLMVVALVVVPVVFLILFILVIVGVPRRRGTTGPETTSNRSRSPAKTSCFDPLTLFLLRIFHLLHVLGRVSPCRS